jgi:hypothetical protein
MAGVIHDGISVALLASCVRRRFMDGGCGVRVLLGVPFGVPFGVEFPGVVCAVAGRGLRGVLGADSVWFAARGVSTESM